MRKKQRKSEDVVKDCPGLYLVTGEFRFRRGRKLPNIVSRTGRVYQPTAFDLPANTYRVLCFALNLILAMIDRGLIQDKMLHRARGQLKVYELRDMVLSLLRTIEGDFHIGANGAPKSPIRYQRRTAA